MRIPFDQPITLSFSTFSDAAETTPADPTTLALDIELPDRTTTTVTWAGAQIIRDSLGVFHYDYTPTQAGHHRFHWKATGTVATSSDGEFDVLPKYAQPLVALDVAKKHLNIPAATTTNDDELTRFIDRATPIIETLTGPILERTITAEQHTGGGQTIALLERPVLTVTSCTEYVGKVAYTVTIAATPDATGTYGATLDSDKGVLTRWASGTPQQWAQTVWVTYLAGRSAVPDNVEQATLELIRHMWETQRGSSTGRPSPGFDEGAVVISGYAVPNRVVEMLGEQERIDGFA